MGEPRESAVRVPTPPLGLAFAINNSCSGLGASCNPRERPDDPMTLRRNVDRIYTDCKEPKSWSCTSSETVRTQGAFGVFEEEVRSHLVGLDQKVATHFSELDRKLDLLALQVNSGFDDLNLSLSRRVADQSRRARATSKARAPSKALAWDITPRSAGVLSSPFASEMPAGFQGTAAKAAPDLDPQNGGVGAGTGTSERPKRHSLTSSGSKSTWELDFIRRTHPNKCRQRIWSVLEDPDSGLIARWFSRLWSPIIVCAAVFALVQNLEPNPLEGFPVLGFELAFDCLFLIELLLRFSICPSSLVFLTRGHNIIDALAALPIGLCIFCLASEECETGSHWQLALICVVPVLRLLKTLRHFRQVHLFVRLLDETIEALSTLFFLLCIIVVSFSTLIFLVEPRDNIASLPEAIYLLIVTISTVGYGDVTPATTAGTIAVSVIILCSVLYMAMPIGIVGNAFTEIWSERDRILLTIKTRDRLAQWGYTAADMKMLFRHFDANKNGELNLVEFRDMIAEMRLGITDDRVVELFDSFDKDGSGGIDMREFTRTLFPSTYHEIFGDGEGEEARQLGAYSLPVIQSNSDKESTMLAVRVEKPAAYESESFGRQESKQIRIIDEEVKGGNGIAGNGTAGGAPAGSPIRSPVATAAQPSSRGDLAGPSKWRVSAAASGGNSPMLG